MSDESLFHRGAALPPHERSLLLEAECPDLEERRRLVSLLAAHDAGGGVLDVPDATCDYSPRNGAGEEDAGLIEHRGMVIGPYTLRQKLGEGGMGAVWAAEQSTPVKRLVALKLIKAGMDSEHVLHRFEAERQALAVMEHPNVARVFDAGATPQGRPYFAMELIKGLPITKFCDQERLTPRDRLELFIPVCQAVQHAHLKGIIHRDLKPSNVLIALYDGRPVPKVIDFGVAKATGQKLTERTVYTEIGQIVGTLEYMAPEQAELNNLDIDTRADVYSLGVILYELLTGTPPFSARQLRSAAFTEMLRMIREVEPPRPSTRLSSSEELPSIAANRKLEPNRLTRFVHGDLDWIVMKALEKERGRRYESANGFAMDLQRYLAGDAVEACPPTVGYRLRKFVQRNRGRLTAVAAVAIALTTGAAAVAWQASERKREQAAATTERAAQVERTRESAKRQMERAEAGLRAHQLTEVVGAIQQAEPLLAEIDDSELQNRLAAAKRDLDATRKFDDAFAWRWNVAKGQIRLLPTKAKELFPAALREYGLAVGSEPAETTIQTIRRSTIAEALWLALYQWYFLEPAAPGLRAVLDAEDSDPIRSEIRAAVASGNADRIRKLTSRMDPGRLNTAFAAALGMALPIEESPKLLKAVWRRQPDSFPLAITIAARLTEMDVLKGSAAEAVGWCRLAVALRPESAFAHHCLGAALCESGDAEGGLAEIEEAMRLAPRFQRAASLYIYAAVPQWRHRPQGEVDKALALCRQLLRINPKHQVAHAGLVEIYWNRKNWREMASHYRTLFDLATRSTEQNSEEYSCPEQTLIMISLMGARVPRMLDGLVADGRPDEAFDLCVHCNASGWAFDAKPQEYWQVNGGERCENLFKGAKAGLVWAGDKGRNSPSFSGRPEVVREQVRKWLAFLVGGGREFFSADPSKNRAKVNDMMNLWLSDPVLASVRDEKALDELPAEERQPWRTLWSDVAALQSKTALLRKPDERSGKR